MIKPRWRKVVNDLLANPARTILVMLAIAVGIFAFGGTLITRSVVIENMNESYAATSPATIKIWGSPFDRHTVDLQVVATLKLPHGGARRLTVDPVHFQIETQDPVQRHVRERGGLRGRGRFSNSVF